MHSMAHLWDSWTHRRYPGFVCRDLSNRYWMGGGQIIIGFAFLLSGIQVLLGKASNVIGAGVACILLGVIGLSIGALFWIVPGGAGLLFTVNSCILILSGILASTGNSAYLAWLATRTQAADRGRQIR